MLKGLMSLTPGTDDQGHPRPQYLGLSAEAKAAYILWHDQHGRDLADIPSDDLASHFAKLKGICIRLALVFACCDAVTTGQGVGVIGQKHIESAIAITEWFKYEARRVYAGMVEDEGDRDRRRLVELIRSKGGNISARELVQSSRAYRTVEDAKAALDELVKHGLGEWKTPQQHGPGGPKAKRFYLVYNVNDYSNATGGPKNGNTVDVDSVDGWDNEGCVNGGEGVAA